MDLYLLAFLFAVGINLIMFVPAYHKQTDKLTDVSYGLSFIFLAVFGYISSTKQSLHLLLTAAITLWGIRLSAFLLVRIYKIKKDRRFDGMRENQLLFLRFWLLQGLSVYVISLSAIVVWRQEFTTISWLVILGLAVFLTGLIIEAVSDWQKYRFNSNPANKDKWIDSGLWSYSRHPNYLGEIMVWSGIFVATLSSINGLQVIVAVLSPLFISGLLVFVSGIPLLEKSADNKWGISKKYQHYKNKTAKLIPYIW